MPSATTTAGRRTRIACFLAVALLVLALAGAAHAAGPPAWVAPGAVTDAGNGVERPQLRLDGTGNVTAVWEDAPDLCGNGTLTATRAMGGDWGSALTITSECGGSLEQNAYGGAVVVWTAYSSSYPDNTYEVWVATRPSVGAAWSSPHMLSTKTTTASYAPAPAAAVDSAGVATVVWLEVDNTGTYTLESASAAVSGGPWTAGGTQTGLDGQAPALALDSADNPVALLRSTYVCTICISYVATTSLFTSVETAGAWSDPSGVDYVVSTGSVSRSMSDAQLARGSGGALAAAWTQYDSSVTSTPYSARAAVQTAPDTWSPQTVPGSASAYYLAPRLAVDSDRAAQVVWIDRSGSCCSYTFKLHTAVLGADGSTWTAGSPDPLYTGNSFSDPELAVDYVSDQPVTVTANGNAILVDVEKGVVEARVRPAGSSAWSAPETLSSNANPHEAVVAADPLGNAVAAWTDQANGQLLSAVYDGAAPLFTAFSAPATGLVASALDFSGSARDWSGPIALAWGFGDGSGANGGSASHAYGSPGAYSAALTATDSLGFSRTRTAPVAIDAPPDNSQPQPPPEPPPSDLPKPVAGKSFNIVPVGPGGVLVREPGSGGFVPLTKPSQIRNGSIIDARKGRVRITIDNGLGGLDTADFFEGMFKFDQRSVKLGKRAFANLRLFGGKFKGCPAAPRNPRIAGAAKKAKKSARHLWGDGKGSFRTVGRFSSATVRGTKWLTDDRCNGTLTKVASGKVGLRDFVLRKTVVVKRGESYFAKPRPLANR